jgi:hypothetical protein
VNVKKVVFDEIAEDLLLRLKRIETDLVMNRRQISDLAKHQAYLKKKRASLHRLHSEFTGKAKKEK